MNILPKKRWHVRTKENIARVRRDEAAAREEEQKRQDKLELADSEARINFLRRQAGLPETSNVTAEGDADKTEGSSSDPKLGVDLFADYKTHVKTTNKELEKERKDEQEKYEKQIGYLTYLGQDTNEALKVRSWYEVAPKRADEEDTSELQLKRKLELDPLTLINGVLSGASSKKKKEQRPVTTTVLPPEPMPAIATKPKKKEKSEYDGKRKKHHKKSKRHKKKAEKHFKSARKERGEEEYKKRAQLDLLRKERLRREATERARQEALFAPKDVAAATAEASTPLPKLRQKYNSQFNPEYAKQNMM